MNVTDDRQTTDGRAIALKTMTVTAEYVYVS